MLQSFLPKLTRKSFNSVNVESGDCASKGIYVVLSGPWKSKFGYSFSCGVHTVHIKDFRGILQFLKVCQKNRFVKFRYRTLVTLKKRFKLFGVGSPVGKENII